MVSIAFAVSPAASSALRHAGEQRVGAFEIGGGALRPAGFREIPIRRAHGVTRPDPGRFEHAGQPVEAGVAFGEHRMGERRHLLLHHDMGRNGRGEGEEGGGVRQLQSTISLQDVSDRHGTVPWCFRENDC